MITGIRIAMGASVMSTKMRQLGMEYMCISAAWRGWHYDRSSICHWAEYQRIIGPSRSFYGASDFVFASRLTEMRQGMIDHAFNKKAPFGLEGIRRPGCL